MTSRIDAIAGVSSPIHAVAPAAAAAPKGFRIWLFFPVDRGNANPEIPGRIARYSELRLRRTRPLVVRKEWQSAVGMIYSDLPSPCPISKNLHYLDLGFSTEIPG